MSQRHVRLALLLASLGADGIQPPQDSHRLGSQLVLDEAAWPAQAVPSPLPGQLVRGLDADAWRTLEPSLLQYFVELTRDATPAFLHRLKNSTDPDGNETARRLAGATAGNPWPLADLISAQSTNLVEELKRLERQSGVSASVVTALAEQSANRTGALVEQMATQSAGLVAEMLALELQYASRQGKAGPSHAFPQVHVVGRRQPTRPRRPPPPKPTHVFEQAELDLPASQASLGGARVALALSGLCAVALSAYLAASRKGGKGLSTVVPAGHKQACRIGQQSVCGHSADPHASKALSVWDGTVATFSCIVGTGLLAMPYAFSLSGLIAVPFMFFLVCCSAYTAHLMAWVFNANTSEADRRGIKPAMRGWGFVIEVAFGMRAKRAMDIFLIVELWGYLLSGIVCTSMNITQITDDVPISSAVVVSVTVAYALSFMPANILTRVNVLSNTIFICCCLMFLVTGVLLPARAPSTDIKFVKPHGLMSAVGILVYSPAGHAFYPALMQRMEEPAKFPVCVRRSYIAAMVLYMAVAVPGYYLYGNALQPSAVQNIGADLHLVPIPNLGWMSTVAAVGMVTKMLALQALVLAPLTSTVEGCLVGQLPEVALPAIGPGILAVSAAVAMHFASSMAMLLNLLGSVFCMNIAFVVPVLSYWKLAPEPVGWLRRLIFIVLIAQGGTFAILGVASTVAQEV